MSETDAKQLQFTINYLAVEDRLLLRGSFPDGTEIQVLLTRRLTRGMLRLVDQASTRMVRGDIPDPVTQKKVVEFTREAAVQQADFSQAYRTGTVHPSMAEGPKLVTGLSITAKPRDRLALAFTLDKGEKLAFTLGNDHVWSLVDLVARQAASAGWNLPAPTSRTSAKEAPEGPVN